ncbi:MAG: hypothetical protein A2Z96_06015 [Spirochaetes bacterium GWB1_48_6]|nr:MAG: hypothetical protein A2Z96_06015 [Spirochaetes bacterium GWB1_48_6]
MKNTFTIALIGCGVVGGGTAKILVTDRAALKERTGIDLILKYVVDVKFDHAKRLGLPEDLYCTDLSKALSDPTVDGVIELVGGTGFAKSVVEQALKAKKHVVTANKALMALHGKELFALARENSVNIGLEASCVGGVPVIKVLTEDLAANRIDALYGIVNGTTNYILTQMVEHRRSYQEALGEAQSLGYAEADPTLDVSGMDSAHKITIMSSLAFARQVSLDQVKVQGIQDLSLEDVALARAWGFIPKLIASAERLDKGFSLQVRPTLLPLDHPLARISGSFNSLSIYGSWLGHSQYSGRGAGASPTASAVVADLLGLAMGTITRVQNQMKIWPDQTTKAQVQDPAPCPWFLRLSWERDKIQDAGVLGQLEKAGITVKKAEITESEGKTSWLILTGAVDRQTLEKALESLKTLPGNQKDLGILPILYLRNENLS